MSTETESQVDSAQQTPTENQAAPSQPGEISSLANYMARQRASSDRSQEQNQTGEGSPNTAAAPPQQQDQREQYIPRDRFDQVLQERNQLRERMQQFQQPAPQQQPQAPNLNPGFQPMGQPGFQQAQPQQGMTPTGMVGRQAPQQQQAPQQNVPDFADPKVQKEWREKIANNPVTGLREFVSLLIQAEGAPLLENFQRQIYSQISPIQQTFVQQQLNSYAQQRGQSDPSFNQVAPTFNQLAARAVQQGYTLTPQVLQALEGIARAQTGMLTQPATGQQQPPFSERPGSSGNLGQDDQPQPTVTPQIQAMAKRFGMDPVEYARSMGVTNG